METDVAREGAQLDIAAVFEAMPGIVLVLASDAPRYTMLAATDGRLAATMTTREDTLGRPLFDVFPDANPDNDAPSGVGNLQASLETVLRTRAPHRMAVQRYDLQRPDGGWDERYWEPLNSPVLGRDGEVRYIIHQVEEVTARMRAEAHRAQLDATLAVQAEALKETAMLQERTTVAEAANRAKSEFLAVMSHELRTPLNAIGGYAELMELEIRGPITEMQRSDLGRIQASQRHLLGLINQILNFTRIESGAVQYDVEDVAVREALTAAEALVVPQVHARGLRYVTGICDPALRVRADREKLQQILLNLFSNAIKFTDGGGELRIACEARDGTVDITVADTGIGIPADKLATVFEPFVQVDARLTRIHEGIGLGLSISRDLARGMGGDLTARSECGVGSTFTLTLSRA